MNTLGLRSLFALLSSSSSSNPSIHRNMSSAMAKKAVTVKIMASQSSGVPINLEWMPFLLNPNMPDEGGGNIVDYLVQKYGPSAAASFNDPNSRLKQMGRAVGIVFNNDRQALNTKRAHALVEQLKVKGENEKANAFMEDLYQSYFVDAQNINDPVWLTQAVSKYGVDEQECAFAMGDQNLAAIAKLDRDTKSQYGVSGVPFYMIYPNHGSDKPVAFSGAYPPEVIAKQLEEASASSS